MNVTALRVLHLSHTDGESGAGRAAYRLNTGLRALGHDSRMLVGTKRTADSSVHVLGTVTSNLLRYHLEQIPARMFWGSPGVAWSNMFIPRWHKEFLDGWTPDVVNLHWLGGGFASLAQVRRWRAPQVWTMHDMRTFTGGCHYSPGCDGFVRRCGKCPVLKSRFQYDLAYFNQRRIQRHMRRCRVTAVAPSRWLADEGSRSWVLRGVNIRTVPYGLDTSIFRPLPAAEARSMLGIPTDAEVVGFGAMNATKDPRKGYDLLCSSLHHLVPNIGARKLHLVVFGGEVARNSQVSGVNATFLGPLKDDLTLALAYSSMSVLVVPSRSDNLPQAPIEALACGIPTVAFRIGGLPDIVEHRTTGWLAKAFDTRDLADGVRWCIETVNPAARQALRARAEDKFSVRVQAERYSEEYGALLAEVAGGNKQDV